MVPGLAIYHLDWSWPGDHFGPTKETLDTPSRSLVALYHQKHSLTLLFRPSHTNEYSTFTFHRQLFGLGLLVAHVSSQVRRFSLR